MLYKYFHLFVNLNIDETGLRVKVSYNLTTGIKQRKDSALNRLPKSPEEEYHQPN
jgi:hypothetical protein